jgi:hypothetical protein
MLDGMAESSTKQEYRAIVRVDYIDEDGASKRAEPGTHLKRLPADVAAWLLQAGAIKPCKTASRAGGENGDQ